MLDEQLERPRDLMLATAKMLERELARIGKIVGELEQIKREKMAAINADNDDLTIAYMTGYHDAKKEPCAINSDLIDFVKYVASLSTGGLLQSKAEAMIAIMEGGNG